MYSIVVLQNAPTRVVPKITERYLTVDSISNMNVRLATQILSNFLTKGIEFYREYAQIDNLKNSNKTQKCTDHFNRLFDILNWKYPAEGIKKIVLEDALVWLNEWENQLTNQCITKEEFLSQSTADELRLSRFLLEQYQFKYGLSSKFNQNQLKIRIQNNNNIILIARYLINQFFGIARQVSRPNDHPCSSTFLQIYKTICTIYFKATKNRELQKFRQWYWYTKNNY
ncbi:hypothetical protein AGLY_004465 [Aphis glycines]|uniref:Transposable element P transposase-like GTP-binding insertion domain-containing protein n=1 Tax=Aphis glycines TaxID=307491 RepID=A0A6G0TZI1_APHGL|nr:hypothetical protein AGLY_004465 [Aphis glycines]